MFFFSHVNFFIKSVQISNYTELAIDNKTQNSLIISAVISMIIIGFIFLFLIFFLIQNSLIQNSEGDKEFKTRLIIFSTICAFIALLILLQSALVLSEKK